uniref:Uncharacterized protein n=1 Tax=Meloidogyne enterolobii TaxID=390850 RepID=A0A6V7WNL4_MELEN|nr:unnamed protein product [Meloidogyne enterolobii]
MSSMNFTSDQLETKMQEKVDMVNMDKGNMGMAKMDKVIVGKAIVVDIVHLVQAIEEDMRR